MSEVSRQLFLMHMSDKLAELESPPVTTPSDSDQSKKSNWKKYALGTAATLGTAAALYAGRGKIKQFGRRYKELLTGSRSKRIGGMMENTAKKYNSFASDAKRYSDEAVNALNQHTKAVDDATVSLQAVADGRPNALRRGWNFITGHGKRNTDFDQLIIDTAKERTAAQKALADIQSKGGLLDQLRGKAASAARGMNRAAAHYGKLGDMRNTENLKVLGTRIGTGAAGLGTLYGIGRGTGIIDKSDFSRWNSKPEPEKKKPSGFRFSLDDENTRNALYGTAGGALLGAGLGYLAGDEKGAVLGGLAGAGLGGYGGYKFNDFTTGK